MNEELNRLGLVDEEDIILDEAVSLALLDHPDTNLTSYHDLIGAIAPRLDVMGRDATSARARADALSEVFAEEFGFVEDRNTYDDPANADMIRILDRHRELPVNFSILYVAAVRRVSWTADVLDGRDMCWSWSARRPLPSSLPPSAAASWSAATSWRQW